MSNCNPRGPSPAALLSWIGITAFAVICGAPLFAILGQPGRRSTPARGRG